MMDPFSKTQRLVLFKLLFTGDTPLQSKVTPELKPKDRDELVRAGVIQLEARPRRAKAVVLTDKAWQWASDNLESELMVSKYSTEALEALLKHLNSFLRARSLALSDFFAVEPAGSSTPRGPGDSSTPAGTADSSASATEKTGGSSTQPHDTTVQVSSLEALPIAERIRRAYLALSSGGYRRAIRVADLKASIPDVPPQLLDRALLDMQQAEELSLQTMDDPRQVSQADRDAAVRILGQERHLIYLER
ncbi:MAG TPA: hypothetical protein VJX67_26955 [Blastocatellia bacterium]|nr:hypothetical protein [Blastocatellia bacterium]